MIRYFITYFASMPAGNDVCGNAEIRRDGEITEIADVFEIAREVEVHKGLAANSLIVLNVQRFPL